MTKSDDDYPPSFWRDKAEEARTMAENMASEDGKKIMLQIADMYGKLALSSAERRERKRKRQARGPNSVVRPVQHQVNVADRGAAQLAWR